MRTMKLHFSIFFMLIIATTAFSQNKEEEFKPSYSVGATVFSGWVYNLNDAQFISKLDTAAGPSSSAPFGYAPTANQFEVTKNSFYLDRAYINVRAFLTPQINARVTPDIFSFTDGTGATQYAYQIKFAYVEYTPLTADNGASLGFTLGVNSNQWVTNFEKYYQYRFVQKTLTDFAWVTSATVSGNTVTNTTSTYFPTADLGLTAKFTFPHKYADLYLAVVNGNGFRNLSLDNRFKDVQITGYVYPLAGKISKEMAMLKKKGKTRLNGLNELVFGGVAYLGKLNNGENYSGAQYKRNRFGGMFAGKYNFNKSGFIRIGGEYSTQANQSPTPGAPYTALKTDARGISVFMEFCPPSEQLGEKVTMLLRYDAFDPNTSDNASAGTSGFNSNDDAQSLFIAGVFYRPALAFGFGLSYQLTTFQNDFGVKYDGTPTEDLERLYLNTVLNF
ncbi:MAG TPA: hypothetical protein PKD83_03405 [Ignavibacteria bacterium]|nr:hypothetical protein [Ignavibacteria bacterium]